MTNSHVYWFGDLNYRINDLTSDEVKAQIETGRFESLFEYDQLRQQQLLRRAFVDFQEAPIRYQPTYKYDPGTNQWDSSEKNRPPAWCDRILWSGLEPVKCLVYRSHAQLRLSDHKPVSALFAAPVKVVNADKHRRTYEEVIKHLDRCENDSLPQVNVDKMELDFGRVHFRQSITRLLTIENSGLVTVRFEFINKPGQLTYCRPFIQIKPHAGTIEIGKRVQVQFELNVAEQTVGALNRHEDLIDEILVLHLDRGKDIFITLTGKYEPSSFGSSIETLIRLRDSVHEYGAGNFVQLLRNHHQFKSNSGPTIRRNVSLIELDTPNDTLRSSADRLTSYSLEPCWDIPKEIWLLVHFLFKFGLDQEEVFIQPGLKSEFDRIRDAVDSCKSETLDVSIHSIAEALLIFLESLSEPVIPFAFYGKAIESVKNFALCKQVILG
jgi:phosphatidylinositol-bisphosphatase